MRGRGLAAFAGVVALASASGCGGATPAEQLAKPPEYRPEGQTKCSIKASQAKPLIVEWPSSDRAALEAKARRGLVPVRYVGCEMEVLDRCDAPGTYKYVPLTVKEDRVSIKNEDDLYANVPIGAASLTGKLASAGELNVKMTIGGRLETETAMVDTKDLKGDCAKATHIVSALTVGAFDFFAGADAQVSGGVSVMGAGGGAGSQAQRETLNRDGDAVACAKSTPQDTNAPFGCGALLRVEVVPLQGTPLALVQAGGGESLKQMLQEEQAKEDAVRLAPLAARDRLRVRFPISAGVAYAGDSSSLTLNGTPSGLSMCNWTGAVFFASAGARYAATTWLDLVGQATLSYGQGSMAVATNTPGAPGGSGTCGGELSQPTHGASAQMNLVTGSFDPSLRFRPYSSLFYLGVGGRLGYLSSSGTLTQNGTTYSLSSSGAVGGPQLGMGLTLLDDDSLEIGLRLDLLWNPWGGQAGMAGGSAGWAF
jgi:hypothetical protein